MANPRAKIDYKLINIQTALQNKDDTSLYVLNLTGKVPGAGSTGNINITVTNANKERVGVHIQSTWIPIDLSNYVSKQTILESSDFRRLIARGMVALVETNFAEALFESNDRARAELQRVLDVNSAVDVALRDNNGGVITNQGTITIEGQGPSTMGSVTGSAQVQTEPSIFAASIEGRVAAGDERVDDIIADLDNSINKLSTFDFEYLTSQVTEPSVRAWLLENVDYANDAQ